MGGASIHSPSIRHQSQTSGVYSSQHSSRTNSQQSTSSSGYIPLSKYPSSASSISYSMGNTRVDHSITGNPSLDGLVSPTKTQSWSSRDNNIRREQGYVTAQEHQARHGVDNSTYVTAHNVKQSEIGQHHDAKDRFGINYSPNNKATAGYIAEGIQSTSTTSLANTLSNGQAIANSRPQSYAGVSPFQTFTSKLGNVFRLNNSGKQTQESESVPQYKPAKMSRREKRMQKVDAGVHWTDKIDNFYKKIGLG